MPNPHRRFEVGLEHLARFCYRTPLFPLVLVGVVVLFLGTAIPRLSIDTSVEGFMHQTDPSRVAYDKFREQFGTDEIIVIGVQGKNIFSLPFLERLRTLHQEIEETVPHIDEVTSLINVRNTFGNQDTLMVGDLMENWPETAEELAPLAQRARENRFYRNLLFDTAETTAVVAVKLNTFAVTSASFEDEAFSDTETSPVQHLSDREINTAVSAVMKLSKKHNTKGFSIQMAGSPVINHAIKMAMMKDAKRFLKLAILVAGSLLFMIFRRITGVLIPLFIVALSLISTLGLMALTGGIIKLPTQVLPSFLLAVGIGYSVHILALFYPFHDQSGDRETAVISAVGHSGLAVLLTSLTTAAGLASFATSSVAPIGDLGRYAAAGVLLAMLYTLLLLPALVRITPRLLPRPSGRSKASPAGFDRCTGAVARLVTQHPVLVLGIAAFIFAVTLPGLLRLRFSHNPLEWLPSHHPVRVDSTQLDNRLRGTVNLEIIIDTGEKNGLYHPELLHRMDALAAALVSTKIPGVFVGKAWSVTTILKETHKALHNNDDAAYILPENRSLTAQELFLFENSGSDDLEDFVDRDYQVARLTLKVPYRDAVAYSRFLSDLNQKLAAALPDVRITVTGMAALFFTTIRNAIDGMAKSYLLAFASITLIMILLLGPKLGLLSMIPNLMPILITMGIMGSVSIPLNLFTMLVGNIAIGLAVDDTLHFFHNARRAKARSGDMAQAVTETLRTTGRAMLITSLVLGGAFYLYMFAQMRNLFAFGLLTGTAILLALLFDFFVAPAMLMILEKQFPHRADDRHPFPPQNPEVTP